MEKKGVLVSANSMSRERYGGVRVSCTLRTWRCEVPQQEVLRETNTKKDGRGGGRMDVRLGEFIGLQEQRQCGACVYVAGSREHTHVHTYT